MKITGPLHPFRDKQTQVQTGCALRIMGPPGRIVNVNTGRGTGFAVIEKLIRRTTEAINTMSSVSAY